MRKVTAAQVLEMLRSVEAGGALDVSRRIKLSIGAQTGTGIGVQ
ncbi:hypothetical protein [Novosphingobium guangzhouense]|nr:hypothetical protein [Novosphingobium guangzhouense]